MMIFYLLSRNKSFLFPLVLIAFGMISVVNAQEKAIYDEQAEQMFKRALESYENKVYITASKGFERIAKRKPIHQRSTAAYLMGARAHMKANNPYAAIDLLTPFFIRFPSSRYQGEAILLLADAQTAAKKYQDAFKSYTIGLSVVTDRDEKDDLLRHMEVLFEEARVTYGQFNTLLQTVEDDVARAEIAALWDSMDHEYLNEAQPKKKKQTKAVAKKKASRSGNVKLVMMFPEEPPSDAHQAVIDEILAGVQSAIAVHEQSNGCRIDTMTYYITSMDSLIVFMHALKNDPSVMGIIGGAFSNDARELAQAAEGTGIPVILPTATADDLPPGREVFQLNVPIALRGKVLADYVKNELGARTVAILAPLRSYARTMAEAFKEQAMKNGLLVDVVSWYRPGTDDMNRQFNSLRKRQFSDSIDVLFAPVDNPESIGLILEGARSADVTNTILGAGDWNHPDTIAAYIRPNTRVEFATEYVADTNRADYAQFCAHYRKCYGARPSKHAVFGYDAAGMLLRSLCANPASRDGVMKEMLEPYSGIHSRIALSPQRQNTAMSVLRYKNHSVVKVHTIQDSGK